MEPSLASLDQTWNIELTPAEIQPGVAIEALVDPAGEIELDSREEMRFPRGSGQAPLLVQEPPPLRVLFIPIEASRHGATGQISASNLDDFLLNARRWLPVQSIEAEVRSTPFVTDRDLTDQDEIGGLLGDLLAVRTAEQAGDRYYHGIMPDVQDIPVAGIAYVLSSPSRPERVGLTYDRLPFAAETVAHELAHNFGRLHAPCGDAGGEDPDFPYPDGGIGVPGYSISDGLLRGPVGYFDYMGYCRPRWTSDYNYRAILQWRLGDTLADSGDPAGMLADAAPESGLLLWGRMHGGGVELNPAFVLHARPLLPDAPGPHRLRGLAADGSVVFEFSFAAAQVPHTRHADEEQFAWFVPLAPAQLAAVDRVELASPFGTVRQTLPARIEPQAPAALADASGPDTAAERLPGGGLRVRWDASRNPVVLLRDRRSGDIIGIGRSGELRIPGAAAAGLEPELLLPDGVRTRLDPPQETR
jgi:hypothetical protein